MSDPDPAAYPALVLELRDKVSKTVSADDLAFFQASISKDDARDDGAKVESPAVLDEILRLGAIALPFILNGQVNGYGPLRLRYLFNASHELATDVATMDSAVVEAAGAGAGKTATLQESRTIRRNALRALKNLAGRRPEQKARVRKLIKSKENPDERSRALNAIADELDAVLAHVPATVAADAGVTDELRAALRGHATAVLAAREKAHGTRGSIASLFDEMNVLDGQILHELRLLMGAFRDARVGNPAIPKLSSKLIQRSGKKKKKADAAQGPEGGVAKAHEPGKGEPGKGEPT